MLPELVNTKTHFSKLWATGESVCITEGVDPKTLDLVTIIQYESKPNRALVERKSGGWIKSTGWIDLK